MAFQIITKSRGKFNASKRQKVAAFNLVSAAGFVIPGDIASQLGWELGDRIAAMIGTGVDAGTICLQRTHSTDKDGYKLHTGAPKGCDRRLTISGRKLGFTDANFRTTDVEHSINNGSLFIVLPTRLRKDHQVQPARVNAEPSALAVNS